MPYDNTRFGLLAGDRPAFNLCLWGYKAPAGDSVAEITAPGYFEGVKARKDRPRSGDLVCISKRRKNGNSRAVMMVLDNMDDDDGPASVKPVETSGEL